MSANAQRAFSFLEQRTGQDESTGPWHPIDQECDGLGMAAARDPIAQADPGGAQCSPYRVPITHGFLMLSRIPHLAGALAKPGPEWAEGLTAAVSCGPERVRFPAVHLDTKLRARVQLLEVTLVDSRTLQIRRKVTIEFEHQAYPACVMETLTRLIYA